MSRRSLSRNLLTVWRIGNRQSHYPLHGGRFSICGIVNDSSLLASGRVPRAVSILRGPSFRRACRCWLSTRRHIRWDPENRSTEQNRGQRARALLDLPASPLQHVIEGLWFDTERNVQIEWILRFEIERQSRHFEECQARAVLHLEEGMEGTGSLVCCRRIDLERADKAKTEEIFIKGSCLLGVPAPVGVVMQTLDHMTSHFGCSGWNTTDVAEGQQLAKSGSRYDRLPA
jgi:hypothetical protein